jgi:hypothetical protein
MWIAQGVEVIELYHHGSSVCAARVRLALAEKKLEWKGHYIDILKGDQFSAEYMKLNPKAVVPTLVDDGNVIPESTRLLEGTGWLPEPLRSLDTATADASDGDPAGDTDALPAFLAEDEEGTGEEEADEPDAIAAE